jgi:hypothetical protein
MHSFRQIGRILRAGVALIFSLQLPAHGSHDRTIMSANKFGAAETKFEVMFLIENIEILNTSPDIDYSLTGVYRTSAGASNFNWPSEHKGPARDHGQFADTFWGHREIQRFSVHLSEAHIDPICYAKRGCLTGILDSNFSNKSSSAIRRADLSLFDANVGPQLSSSGSFRNLDQIASSFPQESGGEGQNNGKNGNDPIRITQFFEYGDHVFNRDYVERGAFLALGLTAALIIGAYCMRRGV